MGIGYSVKYDLIYDIKPEVGLHKKEFQCLNLSQKKIGALFKCFTHIQPDALHFCSIRRTDFYQYLGNY